MSELTWGTPLIFDLWAAGMAGGAYFAAFLLNLLGLDKERRLLKVATYIGVPLVLLGVVLIIADLGEPLRAFNMYVGLRSQAWEMIPGMGASSLRLWPPSLVLWLVSPMSVGGWVLVLFTLASIALAALFLAESARSGESGDAGAVRARVIPITKVGIPVLSWAVCILAVLVMAYTGVVLAASSMELWSATLLIPAVFVSSAVATGVAALIVVVRIVGSSEGGLMPLLRRALRPLLLVQTVLTALFLIWALAAGAGDPLVAGVVGLVFWLGVVIAGLVLPIALEFATRDTRGGPILLVSPLLVLLGGLLLRATVVIAGQL